MVWELGWLALIKRVRKDLTITMAADGFSYFGDEPIAWQHFESVEWEDQYGPKPKIVLTQRNGTILEIENAGYTASMSKIYEELEKRIQHDR